VASETRRKMIVGAVRLLAERGLQETSLTQVLELTGTPRGSIYHHFPNGKDELIASAVDLAGSHAIQVIELAEGSSAEEVTAHFIGLWREVLTRSSLRTGCSVLAVTVATDSTDLLAHAGSVFKAWRGRLAHLLRIGGLVEGDAERFAATLIAAMEGAVVLSRAEQNMDSFELVAEQLLAEVAAMTARGSS
jgi:TetR/AcrR family transcriptional repressor of lmrAB and yxaGH operons